MRHSRSAMRAAAVFTQAAVSRASRRETACRGAVSRKSKEGVAQSVEQRTFNPLVVGSSPTALTVFLSFPNRIARCLLRVKPCADFRAITVPPLTAIARRLAIVRCPATRCGIEGSRSAFHSFVFFLLLVLRKTPAGSASTVLDAKRALVCQRLDWMVGAGTMDRRCRCSFLWWITCVPWLSESSYCSHLLRTRCWDAAAITGMRSRGTAAARLAIPWP